MRKIVIISAVLLVVGAVLLVWHYSGGTADQETADSTGATIPTDRKYMVAERISQVGAAARGRLKPLMEAQQLPYPPARLCILVLKDQKVLQVYAAGTEGEFKLVKSYPVLAASGHAGPKLKEGDLQVPEGIYQVESLNPNSRYHLSLRLNYPNEFDRTMAGRDGRTKLGGDIMIHGSNASVGCVAVGDAASEDLFVLANDAGLKNIQVLIAPTDFRLGRKIEPDSSQPPWLGQLYETLRAKMRQLPVLK